LKSAKKTDMLYSSHNHCYGFKASEKRHHLSNLESPIGCEKSQGIPVFPVVDNKTITIGDESCILHVVRISVADDLAGYTVSVAPGLVLPTFPV
jgi:hypothetical protein